MDSRFRGNDKKGRGNDISFLDSRFRGNDREGRGNDEEEAISLLKLNFHRLDFGLFYFV